MQWLTARVLKHEYTLASIITFCIYLQFFEEDHTIKIAALIVDALATTLFLLIHRYVTVVCSFGGMYVVYSHL